MQPILGVYGLLLLVFLLAIGMPIGFAMGVTGVLGFWYMGGFKMALGSLVTYPFESISHFTFLAIPLFIIMGLFAYYAGFTTDMFISARKWLSRLPGGLAMAAIAGCAGFGAACGSSVATAAIMGKLAIPEMLKYNYDRSLATGCVAASGTLAILIPPSILLVIYAVYANQSAGQMLLAGIIPGIISAIMFMAMVWIRTTIHPGLAPIPTERFTWRERVLSLKDIWGILLLFILVMGGIFAGIWTASEAAAAGAFGAFLIALIMKRLTWDRIKEALADALMTTSSVLIIVVGASLLVGFLAATGMPFAVSRLIIELDVPPILIIFGMLALYIFLGCFLDTMGMLLLTFPIFFPAVVALGFSPIWFGILFVKVAEIGLVTPPVGMNVYVINSVAPEVPLHDVFRGIFPFVITDIITLTILVAFPVLSIWLPQLMRT